MFHGPHFIVSTMQAGTTPIFNVFDMTVPSSNRESKPTNPLGQGWVPPIVAFYDQQGLLRTYSSPRIPTGFVKHKHTTHIIMHAPGYTAPNTMICCTVYTKGVRKNNTSTYTNLSLKHCIVKCALYQHYAVFEY